MNQIEKQVLEKVIPSKEYRKKLELTVEEIRKIIKKEIENRKINATVKLVGSIAKDTFLKNNLDIDFFIVFPTKTPKEEITKNVLKIGRKILKDTEETYAEHPYIRGYFKNYFVEIVPSYKIENAKQKLSAVDRTPLHTKFVIKNLKEKQKNDVRLLKQFLKGINCYGAEAQVEGFSGYLCEILIIKYKTFENLLKYAQKWKFGQKIAIKNGKYPDFETPLVLIDPVDSERNVASALSKIKFDLFKKACKSYLKNPKITYFFPNDIKPWSLEKIKKELEKQNCKYISVKFDKPDIIDENLYPQIRKTARSIKEACERLDFKIFDTNYYINSKENKIYIILKTEKKGLPKTVRHAGPPLKLKKNAEDFKDKWKNDARVTKKPYQENGRLYIEMKRAFVDISDFLKNKLKNLSLGKDLDGLINKKYEILGQKSLTNDDLKKFWTEYLDEKMSWER